MAPLVIPLFSLLAWLSVAAGSAAGALAGVLFAGLHARKVAATLRGTDVSTGEAATLGARGLGAGALQLCAATCRHYWPVALAAALVSRRCRRAVAAAAVVDAVHGWVTRRQPAEPSAAPIGALGYMTLKRLDDLAYGAGLWASVVRERTLQPLRPDIK
jgi:ABC-type uncharacterized transport system permease subunit